MIRRLFKSINLDACRENGAYLLLLILLLPLLPFLAIMFILWLLVNYLPQQGMKLFVWLEKKQEEL